MPGFHSNRAVDFSGRIIVLGCGSIGQGVLPLLRHHGIEVRYEEVRDGHNWENWRDRLQSALTWAFPGPLWMVYE